MNLGWRRIGFLLAGLSAAAWVACDVRPIDVRWQERFEAFERSDRGTPPSGGAVVFVGSSSISGWDLDRSFPGIPALNRGLAGASLPDLLRHADRLIVRYRPVVVVLYGGDNDLDKGRTPEEVAGDVVALQELVDGASPGSTVMVLSIKQSPRRWSLRDKTARANALLQARAEVLAGLEFVDVSTALLDDEGRPRADFFHADGLHLAERGFEEWASIVRPRIHQALARGGQVSPARQVAQD